MISIGDRVKKAIDYIEKDELDRALEEACIAIDTTSQRLYKTKKSSRTTYKQFIKEYTWLISFMGFPGILAGSIKIGFNHPNIKTDTDGLCGIEDIVYHIIRNGLIHSGSFEKIEWSNETNLGTNKINGNLILPKKLIWGLLGAVIFCPINNNEKIEKTYWISLYDFKFSIDKIWGQLDIAQKIAKTITTRPS